MIGGKVLDEPVYDQSKHENVIAMAEAQAFGAEPDPEPDEMLEDGVAPADPEPKAEEAEAEPKGLIEKIKAGARKVIGKVGALLRQREKSGKVIVINAESLETRVATLEHGMLQEFTIERKNQERIVASIFKGKVRNLENRLEAAFVDIGIEKNAFLHYWDITPTTLDSRYEVVERKSKFKATPRISRADIPKIYGVGKDILIQVTKGPIGTKGPRVTTHLAIPGRFLVLLPNNDQCGISRKIENREERQRLRKIIQDLDIPENMGIIIRTAGEGQQVRYFVRDLHMLLKEWERVQSEIAERPSPVCVFREPDLIERTVRDFLTEDIEEIIIDDSKEFERVQKLVEIYSSKRSTAKIKHYREPRHIFDRYNISRQLESTSTRKVQLKGGGYIYIDETEALIAIDVNSGSHKGGKDQESTILKVNLEAAEEICRQLRLRNIGGLIVLDLIDMRSMRDRQEVYKRMKDCLRRDKAKTHVLPISQLGLMEMTRQRHSESVQSSAYDECSYCKGRARIKSPLTMSVEIQRKLTEILKQRAREDQSDFQLRIVVNPTVLDRLRREDEVHINELEKKYYGKLSFRPDPEFHAEQFKIYNAVTNAELASAGERD
ncbi:MAG: Rne/Rng family ribonuclease [Pedosphaera sp.]|nr:Rne/Rng family ribonuclease [Pedosphaera sp.]MSU42480.1 Rne/Rng family ribonuclease [Pedosphaera sp.]